MCPDNETKQYLERIEYVVPNKKIEESFFGGIDGLASIYNRISEQLEPQGILVADIKHHNFCETYFLKKNYEVCVLRINYNANFTNITYQYQTENELTKTIKETLQ